MSKEKKFNSLEEFFGACEWEFRFDAKNSTTVFRLIVRVTRYSHWSVAAYDTDMDCFYFNHTLISKHVKGFDAYANADFLYRYFFNRYGVECY